MSIRKYLAARMVGKPNQVLQNIKNTIQRFNLAKIVPVIKIEKKARREFYIFLAIECFEDNKLPDNIKQALKIAGITDEHWPLSIDEIKKMTANIEIDTHGFNALSYVSNWQSEDFSFEDIESLDVEPCVNIGSSPELGDLYDRLLYWLSSVGEGAWPAFAKTCLTLNLVDDIKKSRNVFRKLRLLGHVECTSDGLKWKVCPSALVASPCGNFHFLCGQRTPKLEDFLFKCYEVEYINQPSYEGPTAIRINLNKINMEKQQLSINNILLTDATSLLLAKLLPDISGWKELLPSMDRLNINNYSIEKWEDDNYYPCKDIYYHEGIYEGQSGLYRLTQIDTKYKYCLNLYFDYSQQRWLKGDWYGLRFLDISDDLGDRKVYYDQNRFYLAMLRDQRWPMIYEKALVLTSGLLPKIKPQKNLMIYNDITGDMPHILANKLDVKLEVKDVV